MTDAAQADPRIAKLTACYTAVVHDVMRGMGLRNFTLPPALRPCNQSAP